MGDDFLSSHSVKSSGGATELLPGGSSDYMKDRVHLLIVGPWVALCYDLDPFVHMPSVIPNTFKVITLKSVH